MIADIALARRNYQPTNPELTCVTSIFVALKLEGDITKHLGAFLEYVFSKLRFPIAAIRMEEFVILEQLPTFFGITPTPLELLHTLVEHTNMREQLRETVESVREASLKTYVQRGHELDLFELCVQPLVLSTTTIKDHGLFLSCLNTEICRMKSTFKVTPQRGALTFPTASTIRSEKRIKTF